MNLIAYPVDDCTVMDILIEWVSDNALTINDFDVDLDDEEVELFTSLSNSFLELLISIGGYYGELFYVFSYLLMKHNAVTLVAYKSIANTYVVSSSIPPIFVCIVPIDKYLLPNLQPEQFNEMIMDIAVVAIPTMLALQLNTDRIESNKVPYNIKEYFRSTHFAAFRNEVLREFVSVAYENILGIFF
jgi:hypothetical protein